jgi:hypothetical protein
VGEEHFADEFAPAAHTRFSNALQMLCAVWGEAHNSPAICVVE